MVIHNCKICGSQSTPFIKDIFDDRHGYPGRFDIHRCNTCGFGQTVPEIPEDKIGEIYTEYYPRKATIDIEAIKNQPVQMASRLKRMGLLRWWMGIDNTAHLHIKNGTRVLDIGCGDCTSVREINAMGAEGYGIEPDRNVKPVVDALGLKVHIGLFNDVPYPAGYFDYITMSQVLEHIHDPAGLLISFRRILKDKGQIIIGVPNMDSRLRKKYQGRWLNWHVPYHINHFSRKSLSVLSEKSGYRILKIRTITPNLWVELQKRLFAYPVAEGKKVPFFNNENEPAQGNVNDPADSRRHRISYIMDKIRSRLLFKHFNFVRVLFLRLCDALGMGESYLVFLEKK